MRNLLIDLSEAARIFKRYRHVKRYGIRYYRGNADQICRQIVDECWNGKYFQTSTGHFCEFYMRDFGWCIDSLLKLGYRKEVIKRLEYALNIYSTHKLTTTITPAKRCRDVFTYSPDTLAFLIRSLRAAKADKLIKKYKKFLIKEIDRFCRIVLDKKTGLVKKHRTFSSIKDYAKRKSSCYDNIMVAVLNDELNRLKFYNPLPKIDYKKLIKEKFWTGEYFLDDLSKNKSVTGDSNVFPFWTGVFNNKNMLKKSVKQIQSKKLDKPLPLKYSSSKDPKGRMIFNEMFVPDYAHDTCWMHMGPLYVQLVKTIDRKKAQQYKRIYKNLIEKHHNFLELFHADETPYKASFYYADEGLLWAANYLTI